jgi:hypothetical protein
LKDIEGPDREDELLTGFFQPFSQGNGFFQYLDFMSGHGNFRA